MLHNVNDQQQGVFTHFENMSPLTLHYFTHSTSCVMFLLISRNYIWMSLIKILVNDKEWILKSWSYGTPEYLEHGLMIHRKLACQKTTIFSMFPAASMHQATANS